MCLNDWKTHGATYDCNRYKGNPDQDNAREALNRYTHYYHRWINHSNSLKFEKAFKEQCQLKIHEKIMNKGGGTLVDWEFFTEAVDTLTRARYTLQYTYPYAYYLEDNESKLLFENIQAELEREVENLSHSLEKVNLNDKYNIKTQMNIVEKRRKTLLKDFIQEIWTVRAVWVWNSFFFLFLLFSLFPLFVGRVQISILLFKTLHFLVFFWGVSSFVVEICAKENVNSLTSLYGCNLNDGLYILCVCYFYTFFFTFFLYKISLIYLFTTKLITIETYYIYIFCITCVKCNYNLKTNNIHSFFEFTGEKKNINLVSIFDFNSGKCKIKKNTVAHVLGLLLLLLLLITCVIKMKLFVFIFCLFLLFTDDCKNLFKNNIVWLDYTNYYFFIKNKTKKNY